jgi:general secretion pathway protein C
VREINGFDLTSPERALEAYVSLRSATELRVGLLRSGAPVTRTYVIVP